MIRIDTIVTGRETGFYENAYLVWAEGGKEAVLIDPGNDAGRIMVQLKKNDLTPTHILLTHGHADHIGAASALREKYGASVVIHAGDADMLTDAQKNLSTLFGPPVEEGAADILAADGDVIHAAGLDFTVMHTPGHSGGGVCYVVEPEGVLFSGDTLFAGSIGRTDFPGSSFEEMSDSLRRLGSLNGDYKVYPGHGEPTTLSHEKATNPFMGR